MEDDFLRQLRRAPPAGLFDGLEDAVMAALSERRRETKGSQHMIALAAFMSLGGGAFAGAAMDEPVAAASPLSPLAPINALAPSALLDLQ